MATGGSSSAGAGPTPIQKPVVMPDPFHGGVDDEWEDWLNNFEACSKINGWDDDTKCLFLGVRMKGVAQKVYFEVDEEIRKNWSNLVTTLSGRFQSTKQQELCKSQFCYPNCIIQRCWKIFTQINGHFLVSHAPKKLVSGQLIAYFRVHCWIGFSG